MARTPNLIGTTRLQLAMNQRLAQRLDQLVSTGLFGKSRAEAAERLIAYAVLTLRRERVIKLDPMEDG